MPTPRSIKTKMKVLIAVLSCELFRTNGNNQAMRDTWLPLVKDADYKIFMGQGSSVTQEDEVLLDAPDDYKNVTYKARAMHRWALERSYNYVFKCYPDTYVCPSRLVKSGFEDYDYSGNFACRPDTGPYCCGGTGYWLSSRACEELVNARIPTEDTIIRFDVPKSPYSRAIQRPRLHREPLVIKSIDTWAEDKWTGDLVKNNKLFTKHHDIRYEEDVYSSGPEATNDKITQHLSRPVKEGEPSQYDYRWLLSKHQAWLNSFSVSRVEKIAVITPTVSSRYALLDECKASVLSQDWKGNVYHAIGVDDKAEGAATTRNRIVKNLDPSYEWLAFVDDDDLLNPEHLSTLISYSGSADIIYSDCKESGFTKTWKTRDFDYAAVQSDNYIPVTVLMRRSVFDKVGGFKTEPYPGEDQNLWLRAALSGARFRYVPQATWTYRKHPQHRFQSS